MANGTRSNRIIRTAQANVPTLGEEFFGIATADPRKPDYVIRNGKLKRHNGNKQRKPAEGRGNIPAWVEKRPYGGYIARDERIAELRARLAEREASETPLVGEDDDDGWFVSPDSGDRESLRRGHLSRLPLQSFGGSRDIGDGV